MASSHLILLMLTALVASSSASTEWSTCNRMVDGPFLAKLARGACIASCIVQNCGSGDCENRGGRPTCVCNRCGNGGQEIPGGK